MIYYDETGRPVRCVHCGCGEILRTTKDRIEGTVCEEEYWCRGCGKVVGYWAYGYFDPEYANAAKSKPEVPRA